MITITMPEWFTYLLSLLTVMVIIKVPLDIYLAYLKRQLIKLNKAKQND